MYMKQKINNFEMVEAALLELLEMIKRLDNYAGQIKEEVKFLKTQIKSS